MSAPGSRDMVDQADLAQAWHEEQVDLDRQHFGAYSSCWCCCISCDPDWTPPGNPYWWPDAAQGVSQ